MNRRSNANSEAIALSFAGVVACEKVGATTAARMPSKTTTIRISTNVKALARFIDNPFYSTEFPFSKKADRRRQVAWSTVSLGIGFIIDGHATWFTRRRFGRMEH